MASLINVIVSNPPLFLLGFAVEFSIFVSDDELSTDLFDVMRPHDCRVQVKPRFDVTVHHVEFIDGMVVTAGDKYSAVVVRAHTCCHQADVGGFPCSPPSNHP